MLPDLLKKRTQYNQVEPSLRRISQYGHETQTNVTSTFVKYLESMSVITPAMREGEGGRERESGNGLKYDIIIGRKGGEGIPSKYRCRCPAQHPSRTWR